MDREGEDGGIGVVGKEGRTVFQSPAGGEFVAVDHAGFEGNKQESFVLFGGPDFRHGGLVLIWAILDGLWVRVSEGAGAKKYLSALSVKIGLVS